MERPRLTTALNVNEAHSRRLKPRHNGSHQKPTGIFGAKKPVGVSRLHARDRGLGVVREGNECHQLIVLGTGFLSVMTQFLEQKRVVERKVAERIVAAGSAPVAGS